MYIHFNYPYFCRTNKLMNNNAQEKMYVFFFYYTELYFDGWQRKTCTQSCLTVSCQVHQSKYLVGSRMGKLLTPEYLSAFAGTSSFIQRQNYQTFFESCLCMHLHSHLCVSGGCLLNSSGRFTFKKTGSIVYHVHIY